MTFKAPSSRSMYSHSSTNRASRRHLDVLLKRIALMVGVSCGLALVGWAVSAQPSQSSTSDELKTLFEQDQIDRLGGTVSGSNLSARDLARRQRMLELLAAGEVTTPDDLYHAAFLLQHSNPAHPDYTPELYLLAHALAEAAAFEGHEEARWLSAATLDRYLQFTGGKQFFGTQQQQQQDDKGEWQRGTPHGYLTAEVLARFGLGER